MRRKEGRRWDSGAFDVGDYLRRESMKNRKLVVRLVV